MAVRGVAGLPSSNVVQLLFSLPAANLQLTTDQTFTKVFTGALWVPTAIVCAQVSGAFGVACAGGIYTAAAKGGTAIVAAAQAYGALTGAATGVNAVIAATGPFSATPILSLTTGNTGVLAANFLIYGVLVQ